MPAPLDFPTLAHVNIIRCKRWHDPNAWSPQMWGLAAAGLDGEVLHAVLGVDRGLHHRGERGEAEQPPQRLGLRLEDCVRDTFNRISLREGFPDRL